MPWQGKRDWKPLEERSCTDIPWLIIFSLFCIGMVSVEMAVIMHVCCLFISKLNASDHNQFIHFEAFLHYIKWIRRYVNKSFFNTNNSTMMLILILHQHNQLTTALCQNWCIIVHLEWHQLLTLHNSPARNSGLIESAELRKVERHFRGVTELHCVILMPFRTSLQNWYN